MMPIGYGLHRNGNEIYPLNDFQEGPDKRGRPARPDDLAFDDQLRGVD
jgi:hypothetical protein